MSRVNHQDTLVTQLRELQRRLRLLEGGGVAAAVATRAAVRAAATPVSFVTARTDDWPGTSSSSWEPLVRVLTGTGDFEVVVDSVADPDTAGEVRILLAGAPVGEPGAMPGRYSLSVSTASSPTEIVVEARRTAGSGSVRAVAFLLPRP